MSEPTNPPTNQPANSPTHEPGVAPGVEHIFLAELLALRTIVLNLHFALASGEALTPETVERLIERADHDKIRKAQERLASVSERGRL